MRFVSQMHDLSVKELNAMAKGRMRIAVSDIDFLETLSTHKCILVPPWIVRTQPGGGLARVTRLVYDEAGNIDKVRVLLDMAREFRQAKQHGMIFGNRFSQ